MKFKVLKGTKLFDKLDEVRLKVKEANRAAYLIVEHLKFKEFYDQYFVLAGGISAFRSEKKPEGYVYAFGNRDREAVFPKKIKANKEILEKIAALPVVTYDTLNDIIKYDGRKSNKFSPTGGRHISFAPGITWNKKYILIDVPEYVNYKPVKDMIEITVSEYKKLDK